MRVMTFNLRWANPADGPDAWEYRKELVVETIQACRPELLSTQEGTVPQLEFLAASLSGYLPLTGHRQVDPFCQYPTIFYRDGAFQVSESDEFWLSETPQEHMSKSWGSAFPRMVTYGLFRELRRDLSFYFLDTHLDNISAEARLNQARMICRHFLDRQKPLILAGDFNEAPDSPVYRQFVGPDSPFRDSWRELHPAGEEATTVHAFDGQPRGSAARIDWILVTPPFVVREAAVITYHQGGRYPSDHFPYQVEVAY